MPPHHRERRELLSPALKRYNAACGNPLELIQRMSDHGEKEMDPHMENETFILPSSSAPTAEPAEPTTNRGGDSLPTTTTTTTTSTSTTTNNGGKKKKKREGRHGARNQHRHKHFVKWLMERFPLLYSSEKHVLDVAGGKGETAARLVFCHEQQVVMVDPRPCNIATCFESLVVPKLPNKWQQRLELRKRENPTFVQNVVESRFRQLVMTFDEHTLETCSELQKAVQNASIIIGMHADGATEAIVDAAILYNKPFVVIPCCVFPNLFSQRTIQQTDGTIVQVRSHEQFCQYLLEKNARFEREVMPFEGRNVAIWWDGSSISPS
jgi:hypothetical protein